MPVNIREKVVQGLALGDAIRARMAEIQGKLIDDAGAKDVFELPEFLIGLTVWAKILPNLSNLVAYNDKGEPVRERHLILESVPAIIMVLLMTGMDLAFDMNLPSQIAEFKEGLDDPSVLPVLFRAIGLAQSKEQLDSAFNDIFKDMEDNGL